MRKGSIGSPEASGKALQVMPSLRPILQRISLPRKFLIFIGGSVAILGLAADWLGFGRPGSFGMGQFLLAICGSAVLAAGLLGKKVFEAYRSGAILLLNTLVLFGILELIGITVARVGLLPSYRQQIITSYPALPYYAAQDWTGKFWQESVQAESYRYVPFVGWGHAPFAGETVNIKSTGVRHTPGASCQDDSLRVFTFGGSTMWGWGSPDWLTVASHLQRGLDAIAEGPVCVVNHGEDGFVSTQGVIALMRLLQRGERPDIVIFYDGANDVLAAYESREAGVHPALDDAAGRFESREHPLIQFFKTSRQYSLLENAASRLQGDLVARRAAGTALQKEETLLLADEVVQAYLINYRIVKALAREYEFEYFFFWQPHLGVGGKPLTAEEWEINSRLDPGLVEFAHAVYRRVDSADAALQRLRSIADLFDEHDQQIWIDEWGHVTPEGNRLVAEVMLADLEALWKDG